MSFFGKCSIQFKYIFQTPQVLHRSVNRTAVVGGTFFLSAKRC